MYEVNTRLVYAMRSVGKGEAAAKVFCGVMNLPPPPKRFSESLHALNNVTEKVAKVSMALAAAETLSFNNDLNPQHGLCPLGDDSWCGYNRSNLEGDTYKHKHNLPIAIMHCIKKYLEIFQALNFCLDVCTPGFYTCQALQEADHARIRKAEKAISRRTKEARIKNRQLKCRQEDDLANDPSNPSYGSSMY
ncbi:uncharacterized protein TNCV_2480681 [Trichonephila clavipes]|nr:uncharacterized protein TNCV_2480681 [Trichonephila clavipes]